MNTDPKESFDLLGVLLEIKSDLSEYDRQLKQHSEDAKSHAAEVKQRSDEDRVHLMYLCKQVHALNSVILQGNGHESVLSQLSKLDVEMADVREDTKENRENIRALVGALLKDTIKRDPVAVRKARWTAVGKIAGLLALVLPGLVAFFSSI